MVLASGAGTGPAVSGRATGVAGLLAGDPSQPAVIGRVDTEAVRGVARLPRASALVLAGALMGGEIERAVREVRAQRLLVVSLNMAGSVPDAADLVDDPGRHVSGIGHEHFDVTEVCRDGLGEGID